MGPNAVAESMEVPSLLQGLTACSSCGHAYYRGQLRIADPTTAAQRRLEQALAKTTASVNRLIKA